VRVHQKNVTLNEKTIVLSVVCKPRRGWKIQKLANCYDEVKHWVCACVWTIVSKDYRHGKLRLLSCAVSVHRLKVVWKKKL
jgi:hypothetical protein